MKKDIAISVYNSMRKYHKKLKTEAVYGPINSRRLGLSLGINPIQGGFACNFGCTYCQYGINDVAMQVNNTKRIHFTKISEIRDALEKRLKTYEHYDSLTICGPTEPVLHPDFDQIVDVTVEMRDKYRPKIPNSLFTNAFRLIGLNIFRLDYVFMKLDVGNEETFQKVNRPKGRIKLQDIVEQILGANVKRRIIQTMIVDGKDGNYEEGNIKDYKKLLQEIKPEEVHLYSLLYKPALRFDVKPVKSDILNQLAHSIKQEVGCKAFVFVDPVTEGKIFRF